MAPALEWQYRDSQWPRDREETMSERKVGQVGRMGWTRLVGMVLAVAAGPANALEWGAEPWGHSFWGDVLAAVPALSAGGLVVLSATLAGVSYWRITRRRRTTGNVTPRG